MSCPQRAARTLQAPTSGARFATRPIEINSGYSLSGELIWIRLDYRIPRNGPLTNFFRERESFDLSCTIPGFAIIVLPFTTLSLLYTTLSQYALRTQGLALRVHFRVS